MAASYTEISEALYCIPSDLARDEWAKVGMALKNELGENGFDLFDQWSQGSDQYKADDTRSTWRSISATNQQGGKSATIATVFGMARDFGYKPRTRASNQKFESAKPLPKGNAPAYWERAEDCTSHPYATGKGLDISSDGLKKYKGRLLIPAYNAAGQLSSVQEIDKDGGKKFLKGCTMAGCWYTLPGDDVVVVAEGWATAKSIHLATGHTSIVAFSSGGFASVPPLLRKKYPEARMILAPDNDDSQDAIRKATKAARRSNCELIMPEVEDGSDFNDVHLAAGLEEVRRQFSENTKAPLLHDCKVLNLATIEPEPVNWLWPDRIPLGMFSLLAGQPGVGKTTIGMSIAAIVTQGGTWPFSKHRATPGRVVILTAEDDPKYTLVPRLMAAGADLSRVLAVSWVLRHLDDGQAVEAPLLLSEDMHQLHGVLEQYRDTRLLIFDPLSAYLGVKDSHRDADVRQVLGPLKELAARHGVAVLGITHLSKNASNSAMARFMGSTGIIAAARAAFLATRHENELMLLPVKNNLAPIDDNGLIYQINGVTVGNDIDTSCVEWTGQTDMAADEALAQQAAKHNAPKKAEAVLFLENILKDGPVPLGEIDEAASRENIAWATVRRAYDELKIEAIKEKKFQGKWIWYTPKQAEQYHQQESAG